MRLPLPSSLPEIRCMFRARASRWHAFCYLLPSGPAGGLALIGLSDSPRRSWSCVLIWFGSTLAQARSLRAVTTPAAATPATPAKPIHFQAFMTIGQPHARIPHDGRCSCDDENRRCLALSRSFDSGSNHPAAHQQPQKSRCDGDGNRRPSASPVAYRTR